MSSSDVSAKILKQVEFYFSDSNLPRDKFLKGLVDKEPEGWVEIAVIASFARMKSLSTDNEVVVNAIKSSKDLLQVSEDGLKVKRSTPLPDTATFLQDQQGKSSYAKGFLEETTLDQIQEFFTTSLTEQKVEGELKAIRMRRLKDKKFKGSVFLEWSSKASADAVAALTLTFTGQETPLIMMTKSAYLDMKKKERGERKGDDNSSKKRGRDSDKDNKEDEKPPREITKGLIFHVSGLNEEASRETVKEVFDAVECTVAFVEYARGKTDGYVRIEEASTIQGEAAMKALTEKDAEICGVKPVIRLLEGEEETAYWTKLRDQQKEKAKGRGKRNFKKSRR